MTISQQRLKEVVSYDPNSGVFIWIKNTGKKRLIGERVGAKGKRGYLVTSIDKFQYTLHRLAWLYVYGEMPPECIDHINGDKIDNRISNLRLASKRQNAFNKGIMLSNKSGYIGVSFCKQTGRWRSSIGIDLTARNLGRYDTKEEAAMVRDIAAVKMFGKFARLNFPHGWSS